MPQVIVRRLKKADILKISPNVKVSKIDDCLLVVGDEVQAVADADAVAQEKMRAQQKKASRDNDGNVIK